MTQRTREARWWLLLAVGCLVAAGLYAVLLVVARMPPFDALVTDPAFFRRCLVVHVDLSLVAWFQAFAAMLMVLRGKERRGRLGAVAVGLALSGVVALCLAAGLPGAEPVLSNYIPAIDHPLFVVALVLIGSGLVLNAARALLDRTRPADELDLADADVESGGGESGADEADPIAGLRLPPAARVAIAGSAVALLVAAATFALSAATTPAGLTPFETWELLAWGGGHVLQFASVAAMIACWVLLLSSALGRPVIGRRLGVVTTAWLLLPLAAALPLTWAGTASWQYRVGFTQMMRWGTWPPVLVVLAACLVAVVRARRREAASVPWRDPRVVTFAVSAILTLVGFALGAMIRGNDTMVPAHYHASIGAVTVAFMGATWLLARPLGFALPQRARVRALVAAQPALFGVGQVVFASGFALAGAHGMARKTYGAEQAVRSMPETVGLVVMGLGGLVAVAGGLLYLFLFALAWRARGLQPTVRAIPALATSQRTLQ